MSSSSRGTRPLSVRSVFLLLSAYGLLLNPVPCRAQVPHLIRYQGQAVDSQGVPLEGPYTLTFRLYDAATAGAKVWEEQQAGIPLTGGHFSVLLGQVTSLDAVTWNRPLWIGLQVGTDPELSPRQAITSVPLALVAERLETPVTTSTITDDANRLVPLGAVILWTGASCPTGYTRLSSLDGKFLVSDAGYNPAAGGSNTRDLRHDHGGATGSHTLTVAELPPHDHGENDNVSMDLSNNKGLYGSNPGGHASMFSPKPRTDMTGGGQPHTHPLAPGLPAALDIRPAYATILLCQKN